MYAKPYEIEEYLDHDPKKPYLLCEFMHDMGNSMGGLGTNMHLIDKYDMYHGGFIWDFIDQALYVKDEVTGKEVLRYGGDFDDRPSDYEFSGDGIVFANRVEKPAMQEGSIAQASGRFRGFLSCFQPSYRFLLRRTYNTTGSDPDNGRCARH